MRPSRVASFAFVLAALVALGPAGCCHWWHHRHCCYPPVSDGTAAPAGVPAGPPGEIIGGPTSPPHDGTR